MIRSILAIDDSATMRGLLQVTLADAGYAVTMAADGESALELAAAIAFDLVVTDHHMPGKNGLDVIRSLRTRGAYQQTPILVLTTESSDTFKAAARDAGATGWIEKPLDPDTLLDLVAALAPSHP